MPLLKGMAMHCTKCGAESTTGRKFCPACGNALARPCPKCGSENAPSSAFCEDCGAALTVAWQLLAYRFTSSCINNAADSRHARAAGVANVTLRVSVRRSRRAFADIKGSTETDAEDLDLKRRARLSTRRCGS